MAFSPSSETNDAWRESMKNGEVQLGCAINSTSPYVAELVASTGYDFCLLDQQHSAVNPETLRNMLCAVHAGRSKAMVRVAGHNDRAGMQQALDMGADAVLVPCVRTVEDVKLAVSCCKYPMTGPGSVGGTRSVYVNLRPQFPGGFGNLFPYVTEGNSKSIVAVQIETQGALDNIEEICAVPGLDMAFIGPGDLAVDMGLAREVGFPGCWKDPRFSEAVGKVAACCAKNGVIAGFWNSDIETMAPLGFKFFVVDGDVAAMQASLSSSLAGFKEKRDALTKK